jgi:hypothetical protein
MRTKRQIPGSVLLAIVATMAASVQTTVGEISGRITDSQWFALPGARATVSLGDDRWQADDRRSGSEPVPDAGLKSGAAIRNLSVMAG